VGLLKVTTHSAAAAGAAMQEALFVGDDTVGRGAVRRRRHHEIEEVRLRQVLAATSRRESLRQVHEDDMTPLVVLGYRRFSLQVGFVYSLKCAERCRRRSALNSLVKRSALDSASLATASSDSTDYLEERKGDEIRWAFNAILMQVSATLFWSIGYKGLDINFKIEIS